jgi:hypothetical protein
VYLYINHLLIFSAFANTINVYLLINQLSVLYTFRRKKMKKIIVLVFISMFLFVGCASGTNPYFTNKNVGTVLGGGAGAYGGSVLAKSTKAKGIKAAGIIGGLTLLGALLGGTAGSRIDLADQNRQVKLIEDVLANNRDNETSSTQYTKSFTNQNGQQQTAVITQRATPRQTYQIPRSDECEVGCVRKQIPLYQANNASICRDIEITFSVSVDGGPPDRRQWYKMCKTEQGWRQAE